MAMAHVKVSKITVAESGGFALELSKMDVHSVRKAYARWAPIYDASFGTVTQIGRRRAISAINAGQGKLLEVGVGTGLSLPGYSKDLEITGIDLSVDMLERARERVARKNLKNVAGIHEMDAGDLTFPDGYFDTVVAMFVMTVVPDPVTVMAELERVCAPGGSVVIVNHFFGGQGVRGTVERALTPFAQKLGWRPDFPLDLVMKQDGLKLSGVRSLPPMRLFTMLEFKKFGDDVA